MTKPLALFVAEKMKAIWQRFPIAVACVFFFFTLAMLDFMLPPGGHLVYLLLVYASAFWFVGLKLLAEYHGLNTNRTNAFGILLFLIAYAALFSSSVLAPILLLASLPFLFVWMLFCSIIWAPWSAIGAFHYQFWSHVGRMLPIMLALYVSWAIFFIVAIFVFNMSVSRSSMSAIHGIVLFLFFPLASMAGIPQIKRTN